VRDDCCEHDAGLAAQKHRQRPAHRRRAPCRDERAGREPGEIQREQRAEGERCVLGDDVQHAEPGDLERERDEAGQGVQRDPIPERLRRLDARLGSRHLGSGLARSRIAAPGQRERAESSGCARGRAQQNRPRHAEEPQEHPRREQRAGRGPQRVRAVEHADGRRRAGLVAHQRAHEQRQRHSHQGGRREQRKKVRDGAARHAVVERGDLSIQQAVVERHAGGREGRDAQLDRGEGQQRAPRRKACGEDASEVASKPQPQEEGCGDDRYRVRGHTRREREDPMPCDLIDEARSAAEDEEAASNGEVGVAAPGSGHVRPGRPVFIRTAISIN
jgi:hypothetical protein